MIQICSISTYQAFFVGLYTCLFFDCPFSLMFWVHSVMFWVHSLLSYVLGTVSSQLCSRYILFSVKFWVQSLLSYVLGTSASKLCSEYIHFSVMFWAHSFLSYVLRTFSSQLCSGYISFSVMFWEHSLLTTSHLWTSFHENKPCNCIEYWTLGFHVIHTQPRWGQIPIDICFKNSCLLGYVFFYKS